MKGFINTATSNEVGGDFEKYPDGPVKVKGIYEWISTVEREGTVYPCYKQQGDRLVVQFVFATESGERGPACSLSAIELVALAKAFGVPVAKLSGDKARATFLIKLNELINSKNSVITVNCSNGFVNLRDIPNAYPDPGFYQVEFTGAYQLDRQPGYEWQPASKGENTQLMFEFTIVSTVTGGVTPWQGWKLLKWVDNPFLEPRLVTDPDTGIEGYVPVTAASKSGKTPFSVARMVNFANIFWPDWIEYEWQYDITESSYFVNEAEKPQYPIIENALKENRRANINLTEITSKAGKKSVTFDLQEMQPVEELPFDVEEETKQSPVFLELVSFIEKTWDDIKVFANSDPLSNELKLSVPVGTVWAEEVLGGDTGIYALAEVPESKHSLSSLTEEEAKKVLLKLQEVYGKE